jgi:hypothetical protein
MASIGTDLSLRCTAAGVVVAPVAVPVGSERLGGLDVLRLAGVCAVVWFHVRAPGSGYLVGQLVALMLLSCALAVRREPRPITEALRHRAARLLAPWAFWWCVYAAVVVAKVLVDGWHLWDHFHWRTLISGTSAHLWYVPFVFVATSVVEALSSRAIRSDGGEAFVAAAAGGLGAVVAFSFVWPAARLPFPFAQHAYAAAAVPLGMAMGLAIRRMPPETARARALGLAGALVAMGIVALLLRPDLSPRQSLVQRYAVGAALFVLALCWTRPTPSLLRRVTPLAMGVYLAHPLVHMAVLQLPAVRQSSLADGLLTLALSAVAAALLARTPLRRFV